MSEPVECFMLVFKEAPRKTISAQFNDIDVVCPSSADGDTHTVEIEVPQLVCLADVDEAMNEYVLCYDGVVKKLKCACGLVLGPKNSNLMSSSSQGQYTNPKTGKTHSMAHMVATPGAMWECPWLVDRRDHEDLRRGMSGILSQHFLDDWLGKRPPLQVMCPDGSMWMVDQKSSNGTGWTVTGVPPKITASPSIVVPGYHAFLVDGVFGPDMENRVYDVKSRI